MSLTGYIIYSAITAALLFAFNANAAAPTYNIQLGIASENTDQDDTYKQLTGTIKNDIYKQLTGSINYYRGLTRHSALNINADLFTRHYNGFEWNTDGVLGEIIYSYMPNSGYTKSVYSLALRQEFEKSDNSSRDFSKTSIILADAFRLDDQTTLTVGLEISKKSSDIRDSITGGLFLNTDLQLNPLIIVYINLKLEDENSDSISETNFDSENVIATLGTNYFFTSNQSVDASYEYNQYALTGNVDIHGSVISLDYFYKF